MSGKLLIVGRGVLADLVGSILTQDGAIEILCRPNLEEPFPTEGIALAVVLDDGWNPQLHIEAEQVFRRKAIAWIRGFVAMGQGIIGPLVRPHVPGCSQCADIRWMMAERDRNQVRQIRVMLAVNGPVGSDPFSTRTGLHHMALLTANEVNLALRELQVGQSELVHGELQVGPPEFAHGELQDGPPEMKSSQRAPSAQESAAGTTMLFIDMMTLATSRHFFLPLGTCPVCGEVGDDSPERSIIEVERKGKVNPMSYRDRNLSDLKGVLAKEYLDGRTGLLNGKVQDLITPFAAVSTNLPLTMGDEGTGGRGHSYGESEMTAILEGLERYCGLEPRSNRCVVHASYADVRENALNPASVGLHHPEQYAKPDFPFDGFDEAFPIDWVWGYSLTQQRPILVPKWFAFYSLGNREGFVYETSNGCALGGSMGEAIFHGMLEVVERDAFLMTWYGRLPLPRVNAKSAHDKELDLMIARLHFATGYDVHLFNATMEHGIPSVFAVATNRRERGMNLVCAAGAHVDGLRAVKGAIHEIAGMLLRFDDKLEADRDKYLDMYRDSSRVTHMDHHSMVYGLKEAEHRLDFLLKSNTEEQSFRQAFHWQKQNECLYQDIEDLLVRFRQLNLDVIVVDQTSPETRRNELYCVKVIIPGMLPMSFGHSLVRLQGLDRVLKTPMVLGYTKRPLTYDELNPYPHPFC